MSEICGIITDFKRFAVHDGDGIRTTVFLQGCPLSCIWCHNPECIPREVQMLFYKQKCTGCGECARVCPVGAHRLAGGIHEFDRAACRKCGKCTEVCLSQALALSGKRMSVDEVLAVLREDEMFYKTSGGGITVSGGEPTMQPEFTLALLRAAKDAGLNTALDTCGLTAWAIYEELLPYVDTFLFDIKHIAPDAHKALTGMQNERILDNLRRLSDAGARIEIRIPLIPAHNDDEVTLHGIGELLASVRTVKIKLLPYHDYARSKYMALDIPDTMPHVERPDQAHMEWCASVLAGHGVTATLG